MKEIVIKVEGMSCEHCVKSVTGALEALEGVKSVNVSLENKTATVEYDEAVVTVEALKETIEDQGYDVE